MVNEKRLIDANAALEKLCEYCNCGCYEECEYRCTEFYDISNIPTEDAVEVVHAHYEWHGGDDDCMVYGFCSNCHNGYEEDLAMVYKYCPNCGAKMDG